MIVQLPPGPAHAAVALAGWTRAEADAPLVMSGAVVLKAAYDLVVDDEGVRRCVPAADATPAAIAFADEGEPVADGYDLRREADTALEKAWTDVVVEGFTAGAAGGSVHVDGSQWLRRADVPLTDITPAGPDAARNLFGWLPKTAPPRALEDVDPDVLLHRYDASFNNVLRRGGAFTQPGSHSDAPLPSGGRVEVFLTADPGDDEEAAYAFVLPDLDRTARLRAYCGHGPDRAPHWRVVSDVPLTPDTLVVAPDSALATVVWRASWDWATVPADSWRKVQVLQGSG